MDSVPLSDFQRTIIDACASEKMLTLVDNERWNGTTTALAVYVAQGKGGQFSTVRDGEIFVAMLSWLARGQGEHTNMAVKCSDFECKAYTYADLGAKRSGTSSLLAGLDGTLVLENFNKCALLFADARVFAIPPGVRAIVSSDDLGAPLASNKAIATLTPDSVVSVKWAPNEEQQDAK